MKGEGRGGSECLHAEFMNDVESERKKGVAWLKIQRERETSNLSPPHMLVWNKLSSVFWLSCVQISSLLSAEVKRCICRVSTCGMVPWEQLVDGRFGALSDIHCWCSIDSLAAGNILSLDDMMFFTLLFWPECRFLLLFWFCNISLLLIYLCKKIISW